MARRRRLEASTRKDPATRADPVAQVDLGRADPDRVDLGRADPDRADTATPADPRRADTVAPADPATSTAARADLPVHLAGLATPVTRAAPRAHLVGHGMGTHSVATSTGPRGATDPHLGEPEHHHGQTGAGRSRRLEGAGMVARSTTGATRKHPSGIPGSISGASTSSGFGSPCEK
jgi:hypothetical protein